MSAALIEAKESYSDGHYEQTHAAAALANAENLERLTYMAEALTNAIIDLTTIGRRALRARGYD
jgi:hypothetical protein